MRNIITLFISLLLLPNLSSAVEKDPESGFIIDTHWELVKAQCTVCHSSKQVTAQRGTRQSWLESIRWMQETQGLWPFDATTEDNILTYLAKNYAPSSSSRRIPLSPSARPINPYTPAIKKK